MRRVTIRTVNTEADCHEAYSVLDPCYGVTPQTQKYCTELNNSITVLLRANYQNWLDHDKTLRFSWYSIIASSVYLFLQQKNGPFLLLQFSRYCLKRKISSKIQFWLSSHWNSLYRVYQEKWYIQKVFFKYTRSQLY